MRDEDREFLPNFLQFRLGKLWLGYIVREKPTQTLFVLTNTPLITCVCQLSRENAGGDLVVASHNEKPLKREPQ